MSFVTVTKAEIERREEDDRFRAVLDLLVTEAVGHKKAIPGELIVLLLQDKGVIVTKNEIQNRLVNESRSDKANYFIGSCARGFFIIDTPEDVKVMADFYEARIAAEQKHLRNLLNQSLRVGLLMPGPSIAPAA